MILFKMSKFSKLLHYGNVPINHIFLRNLKINEIIKLPWQPKLEYYDKIEHFSKRNMKNVFMFLKLQTNHGLNTSIKSNCILNICEMKKELTF